MNNDMNTQQNKILDDVLSKIRANEIRMRPKFYFTLKVVLLGVVAMCVLLTSALLFSFLIFSIRVSGRFFLLGFGFRGIEVFLMAFPWMLFFVDAVFVLIFLVLLKRFRFGYRYPLFYVAGGALLATLCLAFIIDYTPLHVALSERAREGKLPVVGPFYSDAGRPPRDRGVFRGRVIFVREDGFTLDQERWNDESKTWNVIAPPGPDIRVFIQSGDQVFVAGTVEGDVIRAFGIKKIVER